MLSACARLLAPGMVGVVGRGAGEGAGTHNGPILVWTSAAGYRRTSFQQTNGSRETGVAGEARRVVLEAPSQEARDCDLPTVR